MGPHWVSLEEHNQFYGRNSSNRHKLSIDILRNAFNLLDKTKTKNPNFEYEFDNLTSKKE